MIASVSYQKRMQNIKAVKEAESRGESRSLTKSQIKLNKNMQNATCNM